MEEAKVMSVIYTAVKFNKCDTQYKSDEPVPDGCFLTDRVKIEVFQGFSKAQNLGKYFRLRGATSWRSGEQVTGLWRTDIDFIYYGDRKQHNERTLLIFHFSTNEKRLKVYVFDRGFYPSKKKIEDFISSL